MNLLFWVLMAVSMMGIFAPVTGIGQPFFSDDYLAGYARRTGLPIPAELRDPLLRRIRGRERWALIGAAIGFLIGAAVGFFSGWMDDGAGPLGLLASMTGASAGGVLAIVRGRDEFRRHAPRVARAHATELKDYVPKKELWLARLSPCGALLAAIAGMVILSFVPGSAPAGSERWAIVAWAALILAVILVIATEAIARFVLGRAQHAESELELAWDDLCRAEALRALYAIPMLAAVASAFMSMVMVGVVVVDPAVRSLGMNETMLAGMLMLIVAGIVIGFILGFMFVFRIQKTSGYVLGRLWSGARFSGE